MKIATGKLSDGKITVDGDIFADGSGVTIIAGDSVEQFDAPLLDESALLESISEVERGEVISAGDLLTRLRHIA